MAEQQHQLNNHVADRIDAYALGMLEDAEVAEVENHLEHCASCQQLLRQARAVVGLLALSPRPAQPPTRLKQRILARIAQESQPGMASSARDERQKAEEEDVSVGLLLPETAPAHPGLVETLRHWFAGQRTTAPPVAQAPGGSPSVEAQLQFILRLLHAPHASLWDLAGTPEAPQARAILLGSPEEQQAVLVVSGLEPLPPERDYQLWFLREGQPVGSAVFDVHRSGEGQLVVRAPRHIGHYNLAAITPEPAGGSPGPTGPILIAGELKAA